jgi:hypothetical protein
MAFAEPTPIPSNSGFQPFPQPSTSATVPGGWYNYLYGQSPTANTGGYMTFASGLPDWGWYPQAGGYAPPYDPFAGVQASGFAGTTQQPFVSQQDFSQGSPGDIFSGLPDSTVPPFSEPGSLPDPFAGVSASGDPGTLTNPFEGVTASGSTGTAVNQDGTQLPASWPSPDPLPAGMQAGQETGVFAQAGPFSTSGVGPQFSYMNSDPSKYGGQLNPATAGFDPFGGGTGGYMPTGGGFFPMGINKPLAVSEGSKQTFHGQLSDDITNVTGPQQYPLTWTYNKGFNTGYAGWNTTPGWVVSTYTTDPSLATAMPTSPPSKK